MKFFTSDPHWGHKNSLVWARTQFTDVYDMDNFLIQKHLEWAKKLKPDNEFWCLGDLFSHDNLWVYNAFDCKTVLILGNHDKQADIPKFREYFDEVYEYPVWISKKICVSHEPVNVFDDSINVYGHLHGNIIDKPNYVSACLEVNNYNLVSEKQITSRFSRLPKYTRKHLKAPYTEWEKVIVRPQNDLILKPNGHIDLSAMRALEYIENHKDIIKE